MSRIANGCAGVTLFDAAAPAPEVEPAAPSKKPTSAGQKKGRRRKPKCRRCGTGTPTSDTAALCGECVEAVRAYRWAAPPVDESDAATAPAAPTARVEPPAPVERGGVTVGRRWKITPRARAFLSVESGAGVTEAGERFSVPVSTVGGLLAGLPANVAHVELVGPRPGGDFDGWARWWQTTGDGWADAGHYLADQMAPALAFTNAHGRKVQITRAAAWVGEVEAEPAAVAEAFALVGAELAARFAGGVLLASPATTGRDLFLRAQPYGAEWPVMPADVQEQIRATATQGRREVFQVPGRAELPGLVEIDGRFMYAALCAELPRGDAVRGRGEVVGGAYTRAWCRVRATVPAGWRGPGCFAVKDDGGGWCYPSAAGQVVETWAEHVEVFTARRAGWRVEVVEWVAWPAKGVGPLDGWASRLVAARAALDRPGAVEAMARDAIRAVVLHGIGAFHGRPQTITKTAPAGQERRRGAVVARDAITAGDRIVWTEEAPAAWPELAHPEWSATVWARCRARLLDSPLPRTKTRAGLLHVEPATLVGARTDGIFLTAAPAWPDDGAPGRLRVKHAMRGPVPAPNSEAGLLRLIRKMRADAT